MKIPMPDFKEFFDNLGVKNQLALDKPSTGLIADKVSTQLTVAQPSISSSDRDSFSTEVAQLAKSDAVMTELSESIGLPRPNESEDDFVKRAKSSLKDILMKKLEKQKI